MLEQELQVQQAKVREIERIPMEADPGDLLDKVYEQAGVSQLDLGTFKPESELRVKEMAFIINRGNFSGTYHAVGEFLDRIGTSSASSRSWRFSSRSTRRQIQRWLTDCQPACRTATIAAFRLLRDDSSRA